VKYVKPSFIRFIMCELSLLISTITYMIVSRADIHCTNH